MRRVLPDEAFIASRMAADDDDPKASVVKVFGPPFLADVERVLRLVLLMAERCSNASPRPYGGGLAMIVRSVCVRYGPLGWEVDSTRVPSRRMALQMRSSWARNRLS